LISDNEFLILFKKKPEKALERIMDVYAGLVYTIVFDKLSTVCSKEDIEECVSDVFYQLYNQRDKLNMQKGSIKALGEPDNDICIRKYYFGQSTKVIAEALSIKENTVD
jgi:hypothetical protein